MPNFLPYNHIAFGPDSGAEGKRVNFHSVYGRDTSPFTEENMRASVLPAVHTLFSDMEPLLNDLKREVSLQGAEIFKQQAEEIRQKIEESEIRRQQFETAKKKLEAIVTDPNDPLYLAVSQIDTQPDSLLLFEQQELERTTKIYDYFLAEANVPVQEDLSAKGLTYLLLQSRNLQDGTIPISDVCRSMIYRLGDERWGENIARLENLQGTLPFTDATIERINASVNQYSDTVTAALPEFENTRILNVIALNKSQYLNLIDEALHDIHDSTTINNSSEALANDVVWHVGSVSALLAAEKQYKAIPLRALNRMLIEPSETAPQGHNITAEMLLEKTGESPLFVSQSLVCVRDFSGSLEAFANNRIGENESTTSYQFDFNFLSKPLEGEIAAISIFVFDARAVEFLKTQGIGNDRMETWGESFLKMTFPAEHDHFHQLTVSHFDRSRTKFPDDVDLSEENQKAIIPPKAGSYLEDHALISQAQKIARVFEENPRRKTYMLQCAADAYMQLADMQDAACVGKSEEEKQAIYEAVTYFSEITAHRLFRAISPEDIDLHRPLRVGEHILSVADAMDRLTLITSERLRERDPDAKTGLETLTLHCSDWLGDLYKQIHKVHTVDVVRPRRESEPDDVAMIFTQGGLSVVIERIPALDVVGLLADAAAEFHDPAHSKGFLAEAKARADALRVIHELKESGLASGLDVGRLELSILHTTLDGTHPQGHSWRDQFSTIQEKADNRAKPPSR